MPASTSPSLAEIFFTEMRLKSNLWQRLITVAGSFYDLMKDIEAVGADLEFRTPGVSCFGSPSVLVRELSVAGT